MKKKIFLDWLGLSAEEFAGILLLRHPEIIALKRGKRKLFFRCLAELWIEAMVLSGKIGVGDDGNPVLLKIGNVNHNPSLFRKWLGL